LLSHNKGEITIHISRLIDYYFNRLSECQGEFEQYSKEMIEYQKVQEIDEFDVYSGEAFDTDRLEKSCDRLKDIIETIATDFDIWISSIKSNRPSNIWSIERVKSWRDDILTQIHYIEDNIDKKSMDMRPKIKSFKERISEGKRQLTYLIDLLELNLEFRMTKFRKSKSWAIGIGAFLLGLFIEKVVDFVIGAI